ncbi:glycosyltransferase family 39 protein [Candidatus Amarolinea aalborgensis]|jgi:4-amino-4-deoxy-L-arabinose transferase-like glycosyltransferase|uniref:glycosyltransferase family 39 protein n=1 Tax=Candidatus Amarolinea aalborgensis TaxID=2249329 RepID=UPI003BF992C5
MARIADQERWLAVLLALFILLAGIYSIVVPPFETPDEIWHMAFVQHVASGQGLPVSAPNTPALWRQQGVQSPLYYLAAAALTAWIDQSDFPAIYARANPHAAIGRPDASVNRNYLVHKQDEAWPWHGALLALHIARFFSVLLGALTLWAVYRTLALIAGAPAALLGAAFVAFIPQFVFISAAVSNDNAINALAALVLWRVVVLLTSREPLAGAAYGRSFVILGVLLGLALLTKLSALGLVAVTGVALVVVAWRQPDARARTRLFIRGALIIGAPALAISGWWFGRNWLLYHDLLAWNVWQANILLRVAPADWRTILGEMESLERSFWGLFGWLNLPYPTWIYLMLRALEIAIGLGLLLAIVDSWRTRRHGRSRADGTLNAEHGTLNAEHARHSAFSIQHSAFFLLLLWLALLIFSWLRFMVIAPAAQGRYFFPAAPTLALLMVLAWPPNPRPFNWRFPWARAANQYMGWLIVGGLFLLSAATPFAVIAPAYRPPVSASAANLTPVQANLGAVFAIEGVAAAPGEIQPGDSAAVTVRWRALTPDTHDYSVFVHLLSAEGLIVAQTDAMPGGGLLPTSQWAPGQTYTEVYRVTAPGTAYTPDRGRWAVGLYDHTTGQRLPITLLTPTADMVVTSDSLVFGQVVLSPPPGRLPNPVAVDFLDQVTLAGYSLSGRLLRPGDPMTVTLYWQARGAVRADYTAFVHLLDSDFQTNGGHDAAPQPGTLNWAVGQTITDTHTFQVSSAARPGVYQLEIGLYTQPDFDRLRLQTAPGAEGADRLLVGGIRIED